jgi:hypothetical protein
LLLISNVLARNGVLSPHLSRTVAIVPSAQIRGRADDSSNNLFKETTVFNLTRNFALLAISGALLAGSSNLSRADAYDSAEQQEPTAATRPGPFACPAEVLVIVAKALNQASMTDATVVDGQAPSNGVDPDRMWFTDRLIFPD